jgi:ligand-binding sensor domain-containing protein
MEDNKGNIWIGARGILRYDGREYTKVSEQGAYAMILDKQGNLWATGGIKPGGGWSLCRYDAASLYSEKPEMNVIMSQQNMLLDILEDAKGNIWFGSGSGVYRYDGKSITDFKDKVGR